MKWLIMKLSQIFKPKPRVISQDDLISRALRMAKTRNIKALDENANSATVLKELLDRMANDDEN